MDTGGKTPPPPLNVPVASGRDRFHPPAFNWNQFQCFFWSAVACQPQNSSFSHSSPPTLDHFPCAKIPSHNARIASFFFSTCLHCTPHPTPTERRLEFIFDSITRSPNDEAFSCFRDAEKETDSFLFSWSGCERGLVCSTSLPLLRKCVRSSAEDEMRHGADL